MTSPRSFRTIHPQFAAASGSALLTGTWLSFIGLDAQPPEPEWGAILADDRMYMCQAPWITVFPGLAIAVFVLGGNMLGNGLRDMLDP